MIDSENNQSEISTFGEFSRETLESESLKWVIEIDSLIDFFKDLNSKLSNLKSDLGCYSNFDQSDRTNSDILEKNRMTFEQLQKRFQNKVNQMADESSILLKEFFDIKFYINLII